MPKREPFTYRRPVRFSHTDPAGYVFFPRFFEMLQSVVEEWFSQALGVDYADLFLEKKRGLPSAHLECDFLVPCRLGEVLAFTVYLDHIGRTSLKVRFEAKVEDQVRLRVRQVLVTIELEKGRPTPIPDFLREKLVAYQRATREATRT